MQSGDARMYKRIYEKQQRKMQIDAVQKQFAIALNTNFLPFLQEYCDPRKQLVFRTSAHCESFNRLVKRLDALKTVHLNKTDIKTKTSFNFIVRVLLDEQSLDKSSEWQFSAPEGFIIFSLINGERKRIIKHQTVLVRCAYEGIYLNNILMHEPCAIHAISGHIRFEGYEYPGALCVIKKDMRLYLINQLDIEDYVYCVLRWESWPGWPVEVNKAFAIACRSYLITKVLEATKQKRLYHIKNTNIHQTYNGVHQSPTLQRAIEETKGLILTHNKKPIEAMFDSCCGDVIPAHLSYVDFAKAPYLARRTACNFCKTCKIYTWQVAYPVDEMCTALKQGGYQVGDIKEIKIVKKDLAGSVLQIMVRDAVKKWHFSGKQFYSLLSKIKSYCYSVEKKGNLVYLQGRGYGHHVGICQWGARRMIDAGWNFRSILSFYYPGTRLMELKNVV